MLRLVRDKFRDPELAKALLDTREEKLVEGNQWGDRFWGAVWNGSSWEGRNELGKILMKVRADLRQAKAAA